MNKTIRKIMTGMTAAMVAGSVWAGETIVVEGSTTVGPIAKAFAEHYMKDHAGVNITVSESGSGNGAKALLNAACDVATMSRAMKNSEIASAKDAGIMVIEHVVALDGLAVVVNPANPVQGLTIKQIADIYTGKITNWKELGGPDEPIVVISRDTNSGTYETFDTLVLAQSKIVGSAEYMGSNGAIRERVMSTPAAIGYVGIGFIEGVKALEVNGVVPTPETVVDKTYPVARNLYMYTNGRPKDGTPLYDFVHLCETEAGKQIVKDVGFVPIQ